MAHDRLFEPLRIGPLELRNRVIFGAHFTMFTEPSPTFGEPGYFGRRYGRYLAERAAGRRRRGDRGRDRRRPEHGLQDGQQRRRLGPRRGPPLRGPHVAGPRARRAGVHPAHAQRGDDAGELVEGGRGRAVGLARLHGSPEGDGQARHRRDDRVPREVRAQRRRRRLRRHRDAERARVPAPPVPVAALQLPHRRVRRQPREPDALRCRGADRRARGRGRRRSRSGCASRATTRSATGPGSPPTTRPRPRRATRSSGSSTTST